MKEYNNIMAVSATGIGPRASAVAALTPAGVTFSTEARPIPQLVPLCTGCHGIAAWEHASRTHRPPSASPHATQASCRALAETVAVAISARDPGLEPYQTTLLCGKILSSAAAVNASLGTSSGPPARTPGAASHKVPHVDRLSQASGATAECRWTSCRRRGGPRRWPASGGAWRQPLRRRALPPAPWCPSQPALVRCSPPGAAHHGSQSSPTLIDLYRHEAAPVTVRTDSFWWAYKWLVLGPSKKQNRLPTLSAGPLKGLNSICPKCRRMVMIRRTAAASPKP